MKLNPRFDNFDENRNINASNKSLNDEIYSYESHLLLIFTCPCALKANKTTQHACSYAHAHNDTNILEASWS